MGHFDIPVEKIKSKIERQSAKRNLKALEFQNTEESNVKTIENKFGEKVTRVDGDIPVDLEIKNGDRFLFISYDQSKLTHNLHKYPAKFFPELPRWLIKRYSKLNDTVLDPFSGSATTNLEALLSYRNSIGLDIDPFARLLAKVKTTNLDVVELDYINKNILKKIIQFHSHKISEKQIPNFPYRDNWFNNEILLELTYIKNIIEEYKSDSNIYNFLRICLSSIIRRVSNADDNCTRTVIRKKLKKQIYPSLALTRFIEKLLMNTKKIEEFSEIFPKGVSIKFPENSDARNIKLNNQIVDLAVTSPPYANAVDYPRTHQLEIYWLNLHNGSLSNLKKEHVGTEVVKAVEYKELHKIGVKQADSVIEKIYKQDNRRAFIAYKFLDDMKLNMIEVYNSLKKGGYYVVVIGNNKMRGELFESWKYLMEIGQEIGYTVENYFGSEIINHFIKVPREERIDTDWVIVFKK
ncbi:MAG: site-specific DNA-methyltransferase [Ignavibacteria bacterium]|nr:site-specific DNA-methyltransferase [Ignavibacteria bacterium]